MNDPVKPAVKRCPYCEKDAQQYFRDDDVKGALLTMGRALDVAREKARDYEAALKTISGELGGVDNPEGQRELARAVLERWKND